MAPFYLPAPSCRPLLVIAIVPPGRSGLNGAPRPVSSDAGRRNAVALTLTSPPGETRTESGWVKADGCDNVRSTVPISNCQGDKRHESASGRLARDAPGSLPDATTIVAWPFQNVPLASARSSRPWVADRVAAASHCAGAIIKIVSRIAASATAARPAQRSIIHRSSQDDAGRGEHRVIINGAP